MAVDGPEEVNDGGGDEEGAAEVAVVVEGEVEGEDDLVEEFGDGLGVGFACVDEVAERVAVLEGGD